jgi:hypothetical protein
LLAHLLTSWLLPGVAVETEHPVTVVLAVVRVVTEPLPVRQAVVHLLNLNLD